MEICVVLWLGCWGLEVLWYTPIYECSKIGVVEVWVVDEIRGIWFVLVFWSDFFKISGFFDELELKESLGLSGFLSN